MKAWISILAAATVFLAAAPAPATEYQKTITFREPLGYTWTDELVRREERIGEPRIAAAAFSLLDPQGRPVPVQVEVLEGRPEAVRRVRLWFKITLPRGEEAAYRLSYNDAGRAAAAPADGAAVRREEGRLVLSSGAVDVTVPALPKAFDKPVEMKSAPPPVTAVRPAGAKVWYGRWSLDGPVAVREVRTDIIASGPVWAEVRLKYALEKGYTWELTLRAVRGEPWIDISEKYRLPAGSRMTVVLGDHLKPNGAVWMPWFLTRDGRAQPAYDVQRVGLDRLDPAAVWATLRPRWTEMPAATQVCLATGTGDGNPSVGVVAVAAGEWVRPYEQFITVRPTEKRDGLALEFPLGEGRRRWALVAGPAARFDSKAEWQALIRRNVDLPLDRVLHEWVLDWPRDAAKPAPHILTTRERLEALRADLAADADTPAVRLVKRALAAGSPADRKLAQFLAGRRADPGGEALTPELVLGRAYQDDGLAPAAYPRRLAGAMRLADLAAAGRPGGGPAAAFFGYVFADPNYWPGPAAGWDPGHPAYVSDMYTIGLYAAAMMPDHPQAKRWSAPAMAGLRDDLRRAVAMPAGVGTECPGATAAAMAAILTPARTAQQAGLDDPFRWPEVKPVMEFLRNLHTPPDPRLGRRTLAPLGDTPAWQDDVGATFGIAAAGIRETDPRLAAQWMALYRHYYGDAGSGDLARDVLLVDPSIPAARLDEAEWRSRALPGFGAVLRSRFDTTREAFATFKCGAQRGRYHGDELSFHFYGAAMPVALDFACDGRPRLDQEHMHNRVNLGDHENMDAVGELLAMETSAVADVAVGQVRTDRLRKMPPDDRDGARQGAYPRRTLAAEVRYRRFLMLVKHGDGPLEDYLVIRDELVAADPATFNLFVLARSVKQDDRRFRFDGQLEADTLAYVATPDLDKVSLGRWGWPKTDESAAVPKSFQPGRDRWRGGEWQQWLRVTAPAGDPFLVVLYPYRKGSPEPSFETLAEGRGVRVILGDVSEDVFLATEADRDVGGQAAVRRDGQTTVVLRGGAVGPLGKGGN